METSLWLKLDVVKKRNYFACNGVTATRGKPAVNKNQVAMRINIDIPDSYFETPELAASIIIPADQVNKPIITPAIQNNIAEELTKQLGVTVRLDVDGGKDED